MKTRHCVVGLLAHVDAGKTTLAESLLYQAGAIKEPGRVDYKNAYLDTYDMEKARGITIFSKQARMQRKTMDVTILDTPGHVDFSAEMERTLRVLDAAILVISGADGVQGHVPTLWKLLETYEIPTFIFINKMDQNGVDQEGVYEELRKRLNEGCIDFTDPTAEIFQEQIALTDEACLEQFVNGEEITTETIQGLIQKRKVFPCFFGSALKQEHTKELLEGLETFFTLPEYPESFGATVYKISRDENQTRLTHLKITGGCLKVKDRWNEEEKIDQIRIYSGSSYKTVSQVEAGEICAVTGLNKTRCGEHKGSGPETLEPTLRPVLTYHLLLPPEAEVHPAFEKLRRLEEEEPELHLIWEPEKEEIHVQVMGEVQLDVLKALVKERFDLDISFGEGSIVYKETILDRVEGCGHYEPLKHYAEVRLLLEPGERGSGIVIDSRCPEDVLDKNWQRLIATHIGEVLHPGVLTGSPLTDVKITIVNGRAHNKHTEGGDFRQATYRAIRQGLMQATSILLEPVYRFRLEIPAESVGRAMADIQRMKGDFAPPAQDGEMSILTGTAPVIHMRDYAREVASYSKGRGRLSCTLKGYEPCHNQEAVLQERGYDAMTDQAHPTGSIFCSHGAGFYVPWQEVPEYMHTASYLTKDMDAQEEVQPFHHREMVIDEEELKAIFQRTYGKKEPNHKTYKSKRIEAPVQIKGSRKPRKPQKEYLLVDGYNIIHAWPELRELAKDNLTGARDRLLEILSNYQGFRKSTVIVVFDAYRVPGNATVSAYQNLYVVYTKEAETADQYIEKAVHQISKEHQVTVATSDGVEQVIIMGQGALRMSANGLYEEVERTNAEIREYIYENH